MLFLITTLLIIVTAVAFHNLVLMKAVSECPFINEPQTLRQAKAEREYALIKATIYF